MARSVEHGDPAEAKEIAIEGLRVSLGSALRNNIPIMVTSARLAAIAEDSQAFDEIVNEIERLNPEVAIMLRDEEEGIVTGKRIYLKQPGDHGTIRAVGNARGHDNER